MQEHADLPQLIQQLLCQLRQHSLLHFFSTCIAS